MEPIEVHYDPDGKVTDVNVTHAPARTEFSINLLGAVEPSLIKIDAPFITIGITTRVTYKIIGLGEGARTFILEKTV